MPTEHFWNLASIGQIGLQIVFVIMQIVFVIMQIVFVIMQIVFVMF